MGNAPSDDEDKPKKHKLKTFKDITNDIKIFNDICSNKKFMTEFGCKLVLKMKNSSQKLFANIKYEFSKEVDFILEIKKLGKVETVTLNLPDFYEFYDRVITYSILSTNAENAKKTEPDQNNENNEENGNKEDVKEEDLCAICFEKPIDIILPCFHSFCDDCCKSWYTDKNKNECPMCRKPIDGDWQEKSFNIFHQEDKGNAARSSVVDFVNKKALIMRIR